MIASRVGLGVVLALLSIAGASDLGAEVTRIEVISRTYVLGGRSFGFAGPYELIVARVHYAVDSDNPQNRLVVDLDKAPSTLWSTGDGGACRPSRESSTCPRSVTTSS
jgi:hypothetical protein